jgi:hypothetical protein
MTTPDKTDIPSSNEEQVDEKRIEQVYDYAADLLFKQKKKPQDIKEGLIQQGIDEESAIEIIKNLIDVHKKRAGKNILYGLLWCVGGIIATVANFGYIFYGAIIYGAIQALSGLVQYFRYKL